MKLAMVTTYATPSNMRRELLEAVVARGHRVTVVSPEPAGAMQGALAALGGTYREWPVNRTGIDPAEDVRSAIACTRSCAPSVPTSCWSTRSRRC